MGKRDRGSQGASAEIPAAGAGNAGKTRLALQAAADLLDGEGDGVWLVELAPLTEPFLMTGAVAQALGIQEATGQTFKKA